MFRACGGFVCPFRRFAFGGGPLRLHWSCGGFVLFSVVRRVALVSVCALIVGGFVCRVGGCDLRLLVLFVRVARAVLDVALRDSPSFWSRAAVSYYPPLFGASRCSAETAKWRILVVSHLCLNGANPPSLLAAESGRCRFGRGRLERPLTYRGIPIKGYVIPSGRQ